MALAPADPLRLVALSGNIRRPSRSRTLAGLIAQRVANRLPVAAEQYDILDAGPGLGGALTREALTATALALVEAVEQADILVVSTPVFKGSYTGLFKHLFDFVDMNALVGVPVVISATGGGQRHALVVEHQLRPLFGFFNALTIPTSIYAEDQSFENYEQTDPGILARIELAAEQVAAVFSRSAAPAVRPGADIVSLKA